MWFIVAMLKSHLCLPGRNLISAPGVDAVKLAKRLGDLEFDNVLFRPAYFVPTISKHQGQTCAGIQVHLRGTLERILPVGLALAGALVEQGQAINPDWAQKLLGIAYGPEIFNPDQALERCLKWETEARRYTHMSKAWLYPIAPI